MSANTEKGHSSAPESKAGSKTKSDLRIKDGGPLSNTWKVFAGLGALGLVGGGVAFTMDAKRFAFAYLFAFFCFLTPALGALFFVLIQHITKAGWSITVRRTAEFFMSGLPVFAVLVIPVFLSIHTLYPWTNEGAKEQHSPATEHGAQPEHSSLETLGLEKTALAQGATPGAAPAGHPPMPPGQPGFGGAPHGAGGPPGGPGMPGMPPGMQGGPHGNLPHLPQAGHMPGGHPGMPGMFGQHAGPNSEEQLESAEHEEEAGILHHKRPYLNLGFFYVRAVFYFVVWVWLALTLLRLSTEQDVTKKHENTVKAQNLAPLGLVLFAISLTFATVDWVMGLDPYWYSTMWGVQMFAGSVVSSYALFILTTVAYKNNNLVGEEINAEHFHDLGKLQFGFLVFWAYVTFSQFFLIWYSNVPEETTFYNRRWHAFGHSWQGLSWALFVCHFILPFLVLLSRNVKRRINLLPIGCIVILVMHFVEIYWLVLPNFGPLDVKWMDVACFVGVGGAYLAVVFRSMTRHALIPVGDPRLTRALHFQQ